MAEILSTKDFSDDRRQKLATALADWFQLNIGLPTEILFYDIAGKALSELQARSIETQKQQIAEEVDRRKQWATERGMIYAKEYQTKYDLSEQELRTAIEKRIVKSQNAPGRGYSFWNRVIEDRPLTPDELVALGNIVMLTANQAAERLGIDRKAFDKLKKQHGLQAAEMRRTRGSEWPFAVYKQSDIDRLKV